MWSMFKGIAQLFDHSQDKVLAPLVGDSYGKAMGVVGAVILSAFVVMLLAVGVAVKGREIQQPSYFLVAPKEKPVRQPVLNSPSLSATKITNWSSRALRDIFTFNFNNVNERMAQNSVYFSEQAFADFQASVEKTGLLEDVQKQRLLVTLTPLGEPRLIGRTGPYLRIETPVLLTYIGGAQPVHKRNIIELMVEPVDTTKDPEGLSIVRLRSFSLQ